MFSSSTLLHFSSLLALAHASGIRWAPCNKTELPGTFPMECGNLRVPLDYSDPDCNETLKLDLARVPATKQPSKGSILTNFGGPGQEGRTSLASLGALLSGLSGGEYDIVTLDPRGTANTLPFRCYEEDYVSISTVENLKSSLSSDTAPGTLWATTSLYAEKCYEYAKETGGLIGTAFVARDLMQVVDALNEDGMLRYWGFSYGTTLGATVAAMFPDKIDKMILDAVQNVHEYYHALADFEEWTQSDDVFLGIFSTCLEAPEGCALYREDVTAEELKQSVLDLVEEVRNEPIPLNNHILDYNAIKGFLASAIYGPENWPGTAAILDRLLRNDLDNDTTAALDGAIAVTPQSMADTYGLVGIHCSDRVPRASSLEEFTPTLDKLHNTSVLMGDVSDGTSALCAQWKLPAKEIYQGDFQVETKNPVLFIGNTYDGHTPIASAHNISSGFEGSVVLEVNGYGHSSSKNPSKCVYERVSAYWNDRTLPEEGEVCQIDSKPYGNITWDDIFQDIDTGNKRRGFKPERFY